VKVVLASLPAKASLREISCCLLKGSENAAEWHPSFCHKIHDTCFACDTDGLIILPYDDDKV